MWWIKRREGKGKGMEKEEEDEKMEIPNVDSAG
jgi:hypothetical protein